MSEKPYDYAVFIGRFQPFHNGHLRVVLDALKIAEEVIILVGSSNVARSVRNPFTYDERRRLIQLAVNFETGQRLHIRPLPDRLYDEHAWIEQVQHEVISYTSFMVKPRIALVGNHRDHTSYYLRLFPSWEYVGAADDKIEATTVRKAFFTGHNEPQTIRDLIPETTWDFLCRFRDKREYGQMMAAQTFYAEYRAKWGPGPHLTVDNVVVQSGHVLLIERGEGPEQGMLALPGGFIEPHEKLLDAAVRECVEETGLDPSMLGLLKPRASKAYDDPHRSPRGRLITHAFLWPQPEHDAGLPPVVGGDDAKHALWVPLSELRVDALFEDHAHIIRDLLGKL